MDTSKVMNNLTCISSIDGRYADKTEALQNYFSEYALFKYRLMAELKYLEFLSTKKLIRSLTKKEHQILAELLTNFTPEQAGVVKSIEAKTNHDVKALEYYIRDKLKDTTLNDILEFIHIAITSDDTSNIAYASMVKEFNLNHYLVLLGNLLDELKKNAQKYASVPMLARTHGQPASPTTVGKEFAVFASRLSCQIDQLTDVKIRAKFSGATGTYAGFNVVFPEADAISFSKEFITSLGLEPNLITTQIEPHDWMAEMFHCMIRINNILLGMSRDLWMYISMDYFKLKIVKDEVGSSTMPQKVNPIDFENAEGNLGLANSAFDHLANKLPVSRMQRDLSDSTVLRTVGVGFAYSCIAYESLLKGMAKLDINSAKLESDLKERWALLAEPYQQMLRKCGVKDAYEIMKELTRGKQISQSDLHNLLKAVNIPDNAKAKLKQLTPINYIGTAEKLAKFK
jgi:adenylosuccinate lyase